jgi:hypothetical protein
MDLFDKLNAGLEPLGGPLHVDAFAAARRARHAHLASAAAGPRAARKRPEEPAPEPPAAPAEAQPAPAEDLAGLQAEVDAYMSRDEIEGTDDAEVQEFLKERSGFDPTAI